MDNAHATATELFDDAVMQDGLANHCRERPYLRRMLGCASNQVNALPPLTS